MIFDNLMYVKYFFITTFLGFLRDYSKHKRFSLSKFMRTPIVCYLIHHFVLYMYGRSNVMYTIIYERWFMLGLKTMKSIYYNDYYRKREKYLLKYSDIINNKKKLNFKKKKAKKNNNNREYSSENNLLSIV